MRPLAPSERSALSWPFAGSPRRTSTTSTTAGGSGAPWNPRGPVVDACYRKLVAADVPFLFELDAFSPTWSARQAATLREVLGAAVHVVRAAGWPPRPPAA